MSTNKDRHKSAITFQLITRHGVALLLSQNFKHVDICCHTYLPQSEMPVWHSQHLDRRRRLEEEADAVVDQGDVSALRDGESKADGGKYEEVCFWP